MQLNNAVSGALDRLHYEKDPCVRYDGSRKVWIYLHRSRNEEDFGECTVILCSLLRALLRIFPQRPPSKLQENYKNFNIGSTGLKLWLYICSTCTTLFNVVRGTLSAAIT